MFVNETDQEVIYALVATVLAAKCVALNGIEMGDVLAVMAAIFIVPAGFMLQKWRLESGQAKSR